jgi:WD40 repeat protein
MNVTFFNANKLYFSSLVIIGDTTGTIRVYNEQFKLSKSIKAHSGWINRIISLPNGLVASNSYDTLVKIWDSNWNILQKYNGHTDIVAGLEYIDTDTMASGSVDKTIQIWSISNGETKRVINAEAAVWSLKLLSNRNTLASGLDNGNINIHNINTGRLITTLKGHTSWVMDFELIGNRNLLASSAYNWPNLDSTVRIWDLTTYTNKFILRGHTNNVFGLKLVSSDMLASGSEDKTVKLWNITDGTLIRTFSNHTGAIYWSVDMLNEQIVVSGSYDQSIKKWNFQTGECLDTFDVGLEIRALVIFNYMPGSLSNFFNSENFSWNSQKLLISKKFYIKIAHKKLKISKRNKINEFPLKN